MSLIRWDPFRELEDVTSRLNHMFGRSVVPRGEPGKEALTVPDWAPSVDVIETAEEYQIKAELPDVKKGDVKVTVEDRILRLEGERKKEKEEKGKRYHRIERSYGSFLRTFAMPDNVNADQVQAEFKDGILNVRIPKSEKLESRAVEVKVG